LPRERPAVEPEQAFKLSHRVAAIDPLRMAELVGAEWMDVCYGP